MATIGLIGAGNIGSTLARLAVETGHQVLISNRRGPRSLVGLVTALGSAASAVTADHAASGADLVVVSIPAGSINQLPVEQLSGKTVIDTNNYSPTRDGRIAAVADGQVTISEFLQEHLPQSPVVKAFSNISYLQLPALPRPDGAPDRTALPIAGDFAAAKIEATAFINSIGYDVYDVGALSEGWRFQPGTPAYGAAYSEDPQDWWAAPPAPASTAKITELIAAA